MVMRLDEIKFTPDNPRVGIANFSNYFGQWKLPQNSWQNYYLGGANSSVNIGDKLYVKKSGQYLSTITKEGFAEVDVAKIRNGLDKLRGECEVVLNSDYIKDFRCVDLLDKKVLELFGEGSVETGFHAKLAGTPDKPRWNMHDHNTLVNGLLCSEEADKKVEEIFGDDDHIKYMPFIEPGAPLSIKFNEYMEDWRNKGKEPSVILMGQHGKIQTADSPQELCELADDVVQRVEGYLPTSWKQYAFGIDKLTSNANAGADITYIQNYLEDMFKGYTVKAFAKDEVLLKMLHSEKAIRRIENGMPNPDAVVYGGAAPMVVYCDPHDHNKFEERLREAKDAYVKKWTIDKPLNKDRSEYVAKIVLVPGLGAFAIGKNDEKCNQIYSSLLDTAYVMAVAEHFGGMKPFSYRHLYYTTNWEAEHRRQAVADSMK